MIDTGASNWSATGYGQYTGYKKYEDIEFDESKAGAINIVDRFVIGSTPSIGMITINTSIGCIDSHPMHGKSPGRFLHDNGIAPYQPRICKVVCICGRLICEQQRKIVPTLPVAFQPVPECRDLAASNLKTMDGLEKYSIKVLFLHQRGTGMSSTITAATLALKGNAFKQAEYLRHFRDQTFGR